MGSDIYHDAAQLTRESLGSGRVVEYRHEPRELKRRERNEASFVSHDFVIVGGLARDGARTCQSSSEAL
jgi:hypothetical protein